MSSLTADTVYQEQVVYEIVEQFGDQFAYVNKNGTSGSPYPFLMFFVS